MLLYTLIMPPRNLTRVTKGKRVAKGTCGPQKRAKTAKGSASQPISVDDSQPILVDDLQPKLPIRTSPRKALVAAAS